jgi:hypothetical protein
MSFCPICEDSALLTENTPCCFREICRNCFQNWNKNQCPLCFSFPLSVSSENYIKKLLLSCGHRLLEDSESRLEYYEKIIFQGLLIHETLIKNGLSNNTPKEINKANEKTWQLYLENFNMAQDRLLTPIRRLRQALVTKDTNMLEKVCPHLETLLSINIKEVNPVLYVNGLDLVANYTVKTIPLSCSYFFHESEIVKIDHDNDGKTQNVNLFINGNRITFRSLTSVDMSITKDGNLHCIVGYSSDITTFDEEGCYTGQIRTPLRYPKYLRSYQNDHIVTFEDRLYRISKDGTEVWSIDMDFLYVKNIRVIEDKIFLVFSDVAIVVNAETGNIEKKLGGKWSTSTYFYPSFYIQSEHNMIKFRNYDHVLLNSIHCNGINSYCGATSAFLVK